MTLWEKAKDGGLLTEEERAQFLENIVALEHPIDAVARNRFRTALHLAILVGDLEPLPLPPPAVSQAVSPPRRQTVTRRIPVTRRWEL